MKIKKCLSLDYNYKLCNDTVKKHNAESGVCVLENKTISSKRLKISSELKRSLQLVLIHWFLSHTFYITHSDLICQNSLFSFNLRNVAKRHIFHLLFLAGGQCPHCKGDLKTTAHHSAKIPNRYSVSTSTFIMMSLDSHEPVLDLLCETERTIGYVWREQLLVKAGHTSEYFQMNDICWSHSLYSTPSSGEEDEEQHSSLITSLESWSMFGNSKQQFCICLC